MRLLTDSTEKQLRNFYKRPMYLAFGTFFIISFGIFVPILGSLALNANPVFAIVVFIASVIFIDRSIYNRKIKRALEVYEYGDEITIYLESEGENYGMRLNGRPQ